jgi:hypothetical protein
MRIRSHSESHIVELDDGSRWQIFPGDLDVPLNWKTETDLALVTIDDAMSSHALLGAGGTVRVIWRANAGRSARLRPFSKRRAKGRTHRSASRTACGSSRYPVMEYEEATLPRAAPAMARDLPGVLQDFGLCCLDLFVRRLLDARDVVSRILGREDQFVELQLQSQRVAVLRRLYQEDHQERDDCRAGVDDELPGVAKAELGARDRPDENDRHRQQERQRAAGNTRSRDGEAGDPSPFGCAERHLRRGKEDPVRHLGTNTDLSDFLAVQKEFQNVR